MPLIYTDEEGAKVSVYEFTPDNNIYEIKDTLLWVFVNLKGDEEELLELQEKLLEGLKHLNLDYIGWRFFDGWAEFYFYCEEAKGFEKSLNHILKPNYIFENGSKRDKKYATYYKFLMPNEVQYHAIESEKIISELKEVGDNLDAQHRIEHHAMFMTKSQRERFINSITEEGFEYLHDFIDENCEDDYVYGVVFVKLSAVDLQILIKDIQKIIPLIKAEHGRYDGWGTQAL